MGTRLYYKKKKGSDRIIEKLAARFGKFIKQKRKQSNRNKLENRNYDFKSKVECLTLCSFIYSRALSGHQ